MPGLRDKNQAEVKKSELTLLAWGPETVEIMMDQVIITGIGS